MWITFWTAEMFTVEETQIYITPLDSCPAQRRIMNSKQLSVLRQGTHTHTDTHEPLVEVPDSQVIYTTFLILIYENKRRVHSLCYTKSMYHKCNIIWQVPISKIIHHLMSECNQVCSFVSYNTGVTHKHIHTYTLVIRDQPWWLGEPRLADCWKAGPMSSACLWLEERSILSCWERERNHEYVGLI